MGPKFESDESKSFSSLSSAVVDEAEEDGGSADRRSGARLSIVSVTRRGSPSASTGAKVSIVSDTRRGSPGASAARSLALSVSFFLPCT